METQTKPFTHYAVKHGKGWSDFIGLCILENGKITASTFGASPIVGHTGDGEPLDLLDWDFSESQETPVNNHGEYVVIADKLSAYALPYDEAYGTDKEAQDAFEAEENA